MADETGRNVEESNFLREKEAAEHRSEDTASKKKDSDKPRETEDEQVVDTAVTNAFRH